MHAWAGTGAYTRGGSRGCGVAPEAIKRSRVHRGAEPERNGRQCGRIAAERLQNVHTSNFLWICIWIGARLCIGIGFCVILHTHQNVLKIPCLLQQNFPNLLLFSGHTKASSWVRAKRAAGTFAEKRTAAGGLGAHDATVTQRLPLPST